MRNLEDMGASHQGIDNPTNNIIINAAHTDKHDSQQDTPQAPHDVAVSYESDTAQMTATSSIQDEYIKVKKSTIERLIEGNKELKNSLSQAQADNAVLIEIAARLSMFFQPVLEKSKQADKIVQFISKYVRTDKNNKPLLDLGGLLLDAVDIWSLPRILIGGGGENMLEKIFKKEAPVNEVKEIINSINSNALEGFEPSKFSEVLKRFNIPTIEEHQLQAFKALIKYFPSLKEE